MPPDPSDPLDIGALLDAACRASGLTNARIAARAAVDPGNLSRARRNPNARPELARRVLTALGRRVALVPDHALTKKLSAQGPCFEAFRNNRPRGY